MQGFTKYAMNAFRESEKWNPQARRKCATLATQSRLEGNNG
jgi:hypothetical protein